jgi:hypothetical protein
MKAVNLREPVSGLQNAGKGLGQLVPYVQVLFDIGTPPSGTMTDLFNLYVQLGFQKRSVPSTRDLAVAVVFLQPE